MMKEVCRTIQGNKGDVEESNGIIKVNNGKGNLEGRIKAYFENDWSPDRTYPMIIFNTNHDNMADWAERRVRKLDFSLRFKGNETEQSEVERILTTENIVFPAFAKGIFIIKKTELFNYVIHYQIGVHLRFTCHMSLVCLTKHHDLINIKSLIWINFQHSDYNTSQFLTILFWKGREYSFRNSLE